MKIHKCFGLDLGTTNSTASVVIDGKVIFALEDKIRKNKTIPSFFAISSRKEHNEVVGTIAKNDFYSGNKNSKKSVKRDMGKNIEYNFDDKIYTPIDVSSKIISYCKKCLDETLNTSNDVVYDKVIITVPAYFTLAQKDATRRAGELAGLDVVMLLEEPTAAAINYAIQNNVQDGLFFVFDLGGGTFDVSILEKTGNIPQVLATAGNNFLGGDNFDLLLARYFLEYLEKAGYVVSDIKSSPNDPKFKLLMLLAENTKKKLSVEESIEIHYQDIFKDLSCRDLDIENFTRDDFNAIIEDKIKSDVLSECDKALEILKENYNKTLEDITHIIMVGGSSKIPYVKKVIEEKYCVTKKLLDVICYEQDLSVSAGAAIIANAQGYTIVSDDEEIILDVNAPYIVEGQVYLSGSLRKGDIKQLTIKTKNQEYVVNIESDKTFLKEINEEEYSDSIIFSFLNNDNIEEDVKNEDTSAVDIIAPTPVQNERIAVEIIDIEKGKVEKYPIVDSGVSLPSESTEYFKINEYSNKRVILPIWEGSRKIFELVINLPDDVKIGSKISVTTKVDTISNVELDVRLDGIKLNGEYVYVDQEESTKEDYENLSNIFDERINYIDDENEKSKLIDNKENIERELQEAENNHDYNHYSTVTQKMEKIVADMPVQHSYTDEDFDKIGDEIKSNLNPELNFTAYDVDNLVFYGKRFIMKQNQEEAKKCMDQLEGMRMAATLYKSPKEFFFSTLIIVYNLIKSSENYIKKWDSDPILCKKLKDEIDNMSGKLSAIADKYATNSEECEEMKEDAFVLISLSRNLYTILGEALGEQDESIAAFKGLVSKA